MLFRSAHELLAVLVDNPDLAFSASELAELTEVPPGSVSKTLSRLANDELVRRIDGYWAATDDVNAERPFLGSEYTVAVITTTAREAAVELTADSFSEGRLDRFPSYVNPWSLHVFQHADIDRRVGQLRERTVKAVADGIQRFVRPG